MQKKRKKSQKDNKEKGVRHLARRPFAKKTKIMRGSRNASLLASVLLVACAACIALAVIVSSASYVELATTPLTGETDEYSYHGSSHSSFYSEVPAIGVVHSPYGYSATGSHIPGDIDEGNPLVGSGVSGVRGAIEDSIFGNSDNDDEFVDPTKVIPAMGNIHADDARRMYGASASLGPDSVPQLGHVVDNQPWWYNKYNPHSYEEDYSPPSSFSSSSPSSSSSLMIDDRDDAYSSSSNPLTAEAPTERDSDWWQKKYLSKKNMKKVKSTAPARWLFSLGGNAEERAAPNKGKANDGNTPQERMRKFIGEELDWE